MFFTSDNGSPAAPEIIKAIITANQGNTDGYGNDDLTTKVTQKIRDIFEAPKARVFLLTTGTAANALSLATITKPWQCIYCHRTSHIEEEECGASEFYTHGSKLVLVDGDNGRIDPVSLEKSLHFTGRAGVHNIQKGSLSLTNTTEAGTVYSLDNIRDLTSIAKSHGLSTHMDGARFANALVHLECSPAEMTWESGVDILSFGGTKNGCIGVEAVILFNPDLAWEFELRQKRGGHLLSKYRYLSAQMDAYLNEDLWLNLARRANNMADYLQAELSKISHVSFDYTTEANIVFASWPNHLHKRAKNAGAQYYLWPDQSLDGPDDQIISARLVCNWSTTRNDIDRLISLIQG